GAPVSYDKDVIGANLTARCSYCNSSLSVPDEMRGRPAQIISQVHIDFKGSGTAKVSKWLLLIVLVPVIGVIIAVIAMSGALVSVLSGNKSSVAVNPAAKPGVKSSGIKGENSFATQTLNFGSEGIGPGKFKDARA